MKAIQEWLGHSNFAITANFYSHLEYNAKVSSAETIARVLGGDSKAKSEPEKPKTQNRTSKKSSEKSTTKPAVKKTGGRKKKSDNPDGTGESQVSTL